MTYLVSDVMTRTVIALREGAAFKDIARTMRRWNISALPVLDDDRRVVGVVSEADLLPKEIFRDGDPDLHARTRGRPGPAKADAVTAGDLMSAPPVTVPAGATVARAARIMARHHLKRLPVVDVRGVLQGVVSRTDLIKVFLREDAEIADEVRRKVVAALRAASAEPIDVDVRDGVVTLTGRVRDTSLVPVVVRLTRAVEGVVDVDCALTGPPRDAATQPRLRDDARAGWADGPGSVV